MRACSKAFTIYPSSQITGLHSVVMKPFEHVWGGLLLMGRVSRVVQDIVQFAQHPLLRHHQQRVQTPRMETEAGF